MRLFYFLAIIGAALFLITPYASAINAMDSQKDITIVIERGNSYEFPLILQNVDDDSGIEILGDKDGWVGFWNPDAYQYTVITGQFLVLISIEVPENANLGEYDFEITSGTNVISKLKLKVTIQLSDAKAYEKLADVDNEVGDLKTKVLVLSDDIGDLRSDVATLEYSLSEKVSEIQDYQKDLTKLETENEKLSDDLDEVSELYQNASKKNEELTTFTGMLVNTQIPGMFTMGIILGITLVTVIVKREIVKRKVKSKIKCSDSRQKPQKDKDLFRYSYTGR
ncbi:MAG: hypothetical protein JW789_01415 [Candidatus Aenigmarchaeota archaeon]|nr:hypothetical protein [Candidatus Aenigmarchaeota archaeon]